MLHEFSNPKLGFAIGIMKLRGLTGLRTCGVGGVPHLRMAPFGSFAAAIRCKASSPSQDEVLSALLTLLFLGRGWYYNEGC